MATLPAPTYTGTIDNSINNTAQGDALVKSNQAQAAVLGVKIPGSTYMPPPTLYNPDGSVNTQAGAGAAKPPASTPASSTSTSTSDTSGVDTTASDQAKTDLATKQAADAKVNQDTYDKLQGLINGTTPLTAGEEAQVNGLTSQYAQLIADQQTANQNETDAQSILDIRQGRTQYMPMQHIQDINTVVSKGIAKVADLQVKEAAAVASMTDAFRTNDINAIKDAWTQYNNISKDRKAEFQKTIDDTQKAIKDAQDEKIAADKVTYDTVTKPIQDMAENAAKNGASPDVIKAIQGAKTVDEAIAAAGNTLETATGTMGEYLFYKNQATQSGVTPLDYAAWTAKQDQKDINTAYNKAYATAKGAAAGTAAGAGVFDDTPDATGLGGGKVGQTILGATGLSNGAFNTLVGNTAAISRLTAAQKNQINSEIRAWSIKNGVDTSVLMPRVKGLYGTITNNVARANNIDTTSGEFNGSVDLFIANIDAADKSANSAFTFPGMGTLSPLNHTLSAQNILDTMVGKQTNSPFTTKYSMYLANMANDYAAFLAASQRSTATGGIPDVNESEKLQAAQVVANGINSGSAEALKEGMTATADKNKQVVNDLVTKSQRQMWNVFGVGDKFVPGTNSISDTLVQNSQQEDQKVQSGLKAIQSTNPKLYTAASGMYISNNPTTGQPYSAEDILQAFPELAQ